MGRTAAVAAAALVLASAPAFGQEGDRIIREDPRNAPYATFGGAYPSVIVAPSGLVLGVGATIQFAIDRTLPGTTFLPGTVARWVIVKVGAQAYAMPLYALPIAQDGGQP